MVITLRLRNLLMLTTLKIWELRLLVEKFICPFGVLNEIHSDQGTKFESSPFKEVCTLLSLVKTNTSPYYPQSNGMIERMNRTLKNMIMSFVFKNEKEDWNQHIPHKPYGYHLLC